MHSWELLSGLVRWCKTHLAITFLMCRVWIRILKTEVDDMFVSSAVFSLVCQFSSSRLIDDNL